jgi:hypothetical protein
MFPEPVPFPLAHPAAVLPLRRLCPQWLSLAGLVIGSLAPDAAYALPRLQLGPFAHGWLGAAAFGLLAGGVGVALLAWVRRPLVATLPQPHREALQPLCQRGFGPPARLAVSLVLGAWTHVLWDALIREHHWMAQLGEGSRSDTAYLPGTDLLIARLPWYASTVAGLLVLGVVYLFWLRKRRAAVPITPGGETVRWGAWMLILLTPGVAILPFTLRYAEGWPHSYAVRHFFYVWSGAYLVALTTLLVVVGAGLHLAGRLSASRSGSARVKGPF